MYDAPIVSVEPNRSSPGALVVTVACPACGRKHTHGLPVGERLPSHRVAHCLTRNDGYLITDPDGLVA